MSPAEECSDPTELRFTAALALISSPFWFVLLGHLLGDTDLPWRNGRCALATLLSCFALAGANRLYTLQATAGVVIGIWGVAALTACLILWIGGLR